ncbi:acyl-CoA N-acyltransferase [Coprinopsis marcescibilis]|uniref:Acyl-CoA N-acyltransferase n=1 Tax=Coprinopsis marcescibilis TaxID=230819 RepID=A0A5C3L521_COPMA|nr:acyl-CoA N-acyltransferase [Coprinopsis marcescibilis]
MTFINSYKTPEIVPITETTEPYDINFNSPLPPKFETDRVRLIPFIPSKHARAFHTAYTQTPEIEKYLPIAWSEYPQFLTDLHHFITSDPSSILFAIIDKSKEHDENLHESLAGVIGYLHNSPQNLSTEIGPVIVFPAWQRTFLSSHAIGLMLKHALNLPSQGGLGFRRVAWTANPNNKGSIRAAERMGLSVEGTLRWTWVLPAGRDGGKPPVDGKRGSGEGRDSTLLSVCWDDWENGVRDLVEQQINRK